MNPFLDLPPTALPHIVAFGKVPQNRNPFAKFQESLSKIKVRSKKAALDGRVDVRLTDFGRSIQALNRLIYPFIVQSNLPFDHADVVQFP